MTIANTFIMKFGTRALIGPRQRVLEALKWLADNDPEGTGELNGDVITYAFTDKSRLVLDVKTHEFSKPN